MAVLPTGSDILVWFTVCTYCWLARIILTGLLLCWAVLHVKEFSRLPQATTELVISLFRNTWCVVAPTLHQLMATERIHNTTCNIISQFTRELDDWFLVFHVLSRMTFMCAYISCVHVCVVVNCAFYLGRDGTRPSDAKQVARQRPNVVSSELGRLQSVVLRIRPTICQRRKICPRAIKLQLAIYSSS